MELEGILALFDEQVRRRAADEDGLYVGGGWNAVLWHGGDRGRALERLRALPGHREWKLYGHDPAPVKAFLRAEGLKPDDEEALLVAEAAAIPDTDVDVVEDATAFAELAARVFGGGGPSPLPENSIGVVARVDGIPVSGGRVDLDPGIEFAGLFGGITLEEFRGRGLYRATVAARARIARERGYRWLYVDALPTSAPILRRLGFTQISTTTPFVVRDS